MFWRTPPATQKSDKTAKLAEIDSELFFLLAKRLRWAGVTEGYPRTRKEVFGRDVDVDRWTGLKVCDAAFDDSCCSIVVGCREGSERTMAAGPVAIDSSS